MKDIGSKLQARETLPEYAGVVGPVSEIGRESRKSVVR